jgi:2-phospho-L-lactate guanylyltransferase
MPVKRLALAKTRLAEVAGEHRVALALAFALDTAAAALACDHVAGLVVVTDEPDALHALTQIGALVVADGPDAGLNPALAHGADAAAQAHPGTALGAISADLPALRPDELRAALTAAPAAGAAFVRDAEGSGTTTLLARRRSDFLPAFGPGSAAAHLSGGAVELLGDAFPSLRQDVDTPADLVRALAMRVGSYTAAVARQLTAAGCH